jgi:hypothetical protein
LGIIEIRALSTRENAQGSILGADGSTRDWGFEESKAAALQLLMERLGNRRGNRAHIDDQSPRCCTMARPMRTEQKFLDVGTIRHAGNNEPRMVCGFLGRITSYTAQCNDRFGFCFGSVETANRISRPDQIGRHADTHQAHPQKGYGLARIGSHQFKSLTVIRWIFCKQQVDHGQKINSGFRSIPGISPTRFSRGDEGMRNEHAVVMLNQLIGTG